MKIEQINDYLCKATADEGKMFWRDGFCYGSVIYDNLQELKLYLENHYYLKEKGTVKDGEE